MKDDITAFILPTLRNSLIMSVSTPPGQTAITRTLSSAQAVHRALPRPLTQSVNQKIHFVKEIHPGSFTPLL